MQGDVGQREAVEQRQQGQTFACVLPAQPQFDRETQLGKLFAERDEQALHLVGVGQDARSVVASGQ